MLYKLFKRSVPWINRIGILDFQQKPGLPEGSIHPLQPDLCETRLSCSSLKTPVWTTLAEEKGSHNLHQRTPPSLISFPSLLQVWTKSWLSGEKDGGAGLRSQVFKHMKFKCEGLCKILYVPPLWGLRAGDARPNITLRTSAAINKQGNN